MHGKPPVSANAPCDRRAMVGRDWAECGRGAGSGQTYCGLLSCWPCYSPPPIQAQMLGQGRVESAAGRPPHRVLRRLAEVPCGKGERAASGQNSRPSLHLGQPWFLSVMYIVICSL